jgi:hypothetical protein
VHANPWAVAWPGQIVPTLPGSHELGGSRGQGRHRRVPVAVPLQEVELFHRRRFHRLRTRLTNRYGRPGKFFLISYNRCRVLHKSIWSLKIAFFFFFWKTSVRRFGGDKGRHLAEPLNVSMGGIGWK